ncbi:unnamed protein product [Ambrosiozyma monospora]|uniref:Unnamed protein product n=1 Tax=Ambrosiozyma monospora TaxID=43982 RepID=A0ACB5STI6_AMBMO|nr:unnamed protein product [Ambrosiozyma monospora]
MASRHRRSKSIHIDRSRRRATKNSLRATITKKQVEEMVHKLMEESDDTPRHAFDPNRVMRIDRNDEFADWAHYPFDQQDEEEEDESDMIDLTSTRSQSVLSVEDQEQEKEIEHQNEQEQKEQEQDVNIGDSNGASFEVLQDDIRPSNNENDVPENVNEKEDETENMVKDLRQRYDFINSQKELCKQQMATEPDNQTRTTEEGPIFDNSMLEQVTDLVMALEEGFKMLEKKTQEQQNGTDVTAGMSQLSDKMNSIHEEIKGLREEQRKFHEQQAELMRSQLIDRQDQFRKLQAFIKRKFTDIVNNQRKFQESNPISKEQPQQNDENGSEKVNEEVTIPSRSVLTVSPKQSEMVATKETVASKESPNVNDTQVSGTNNPEPPQATNSKESHDHSDLNPRPTKIQRTTGKSKLDTSNIFKIASQREPKRFDIDEIFSTGTTKSHREKQEKSKPAPELKRPTSKTRAAIKTRNPFYDDSPSSNSFEAISLDSSDRSRSSSPFEKSPKRTPSGKNPLRETEIPRSKNNLIYNCLRR